MNYKVTRSLRVYQEGMCCYLLDMPEGNLKQASKRRGRALKIGLEALDPAKLHQEALIALVSPPSETGAQDENIRLAGEFSTEVVTSIEGNHRAAVDANLRLNSAIDKLNHRTKELTTFNNRLKAVIKSRELHDDESRFATSLPPTSNEKPQPMPMKCP